MGEIVEVKKTLRIRNKLGLHARAAVKFVQLAGKYQSEITVGRGGQDANGKSIMGLLTLVAAWGTDIDRGFDEGVVDA
jgi:phosphocarrier protein HPr